MTNGCKICTSPFTLYFFSDPSGSGDSCYHLSGGSDHGGQTSGTTYCSGLGALCYLATPNTLDEMNFFITSLNTDVWLSGLRPAGGSVTSYTWRPSGLSVDITWCKSGCSGSEDSLRFKNGGCGGSIFGNGCLENKNEPDDNKYFCEIAV